MRKDHPNSKIFRGHSAKSKMKYHDNSDLKEITELDGSPMKSPVSGRLKGKYSKKTGLRLVK